MTYSPTRPYWTRLLLFAVAVGLTACTGAQEDQHQEFRARRARMSLAGRGDPWSHLTSESKYLFLALHERFSPTEVEGILGLTREELLTEIERLQEIGLLKAIGAKFKHILLQFLIEAVVLTLAGGLIGMTVGLTISYFAAGALSIPFVISYKAVGLAVGVSAGVGIVFGFYPARRAAKLNPIDALRYE